MSEEQFPIKGDMGLAWLKLKNSLCLTYKGYRANSSGMGKYLFEGKTFTINSFMDYIDDRIEQGAKALQNSLNKNK